MMGYVKVVSVIRDKGDEITLVLTCNNESDADKLFNGLNSDLIKYGVVQLHLTLPERGPRPGRGYHEEDAEDNEEGS